MKIKNLLHELALSTRIRVGSIDEQREFLGMLSTHSARSLYIRTRTALIELGPGKVRYWTEWSQIEFTEIEYVDCEIVVTQKGEEE